MRNCINKIILLNIKTVKKTHKHTWPGTECNTHNETTTLKVNNSNRRADKLPTIKIITY